MLQVPMVKYVLHQKCYSVLSSPVSITEHIMHLSESALNNIIVILPLIITKFSLVIIHSPCPSPSPLQVRVKDRDLMYATIKKENNPYFPNQITTDDDGELSTLARTKHSFAIFLQRNVCVQGGCS